MIAPPLAAGPGLQVVVPGGIDTDALGTFTGEIARAGSMFDAAFAKARVGMTALGLPLGLASEGSYGPHPDAPVVGLGIEVIVFVDDARGLVVSEQLVDPRPMFAHVVVTRPGDVERFVREVGFPAQALVVGPNLAAAAVPPPAKGIRDPRRLGEAIRAATAMSGDGAALVQTDMRAHCNPTRMATIRRLACRLAARLNRRCPACGAPGFGRTGETGGLPCRDCGAPTSFIAREIHGCAACPHRESLPRSDGGVDADPRHCPRCNP